MARYSSRRSSRSGGRKRSYASVGRRRSYSKMARRAGRKLKFATVGFARNVEKKYFDKTYQANSTEILTGQTTAVLPNNGVTYISNTWGDYDFGSQVATAAIVSNDMMKGLDTGTTARTRIGNKIKPVYLKGAFTFTAAAVVGSGSIPDPMDMGGEKMVFGGVVLPYLRTTFRFAIVKDLQVNSTDTQITWGQVFDTTNKQNGVHSELNVDNMGRFIVLEDKIFTVDADTPQKTCTFNISGGRIGSVRYNGPSVSALTDKGIYVVWAAFVMGAAVTNANLIQLASPVGHSRLSFTDD